MAVVFSRNILDGTPIPDNITKYAMQYDYPQLPENAPKGQWAVGLLALQAAFRIHVDNNPCSIPKYALTLRGFNI